VQGTDLFFGKIKNVLQAISILSTLKNTADFKWNTFLCQHRVVDSGSHQVQGLLKAVPFPTGDSETELPTPDVASVCPHNPQDICERVGRGAFFSFVLSRLPEDYRRSK